MTCRWRKKNARFGAPLRALQARSAASRLARACCLPARSRWARAAARSSRRGGRRGAACAPAQPPTPLPRRVPPAAARDAGHAFAPRARAHWRAGASPRPQYARVPCFLNTRLRLAQSTGEAGNKWLEGAKRLSAEHLPPLREAAQRIAQQTAERVPHSAKAVEFSTGLWARLPEPAQKAAPPVAGALGVRPAKAGRSVRCAAGAGMISKGRTPRALPRDAPRHSRAAARCCCWAP